MKAPSPPHSTTETSRPAETPSNSNQQQQPASGDLGSSGDVAQMLSLIEKLATSVADLKTDVREIRSKVDAQEASLQKAVGDMSNRLPLESIAEIRRRADSIESTVIRIKNDVEGRDYKEHLTSLQLALHDTRDSLLNGLPQSMSQSKSHSSAHKCRAN